MTITVNLTKRIKTENGWSTFLPTVMGKNKRMTNKVVLDGAEIEKAGTFYIDWYEAGKRRRQAVGTDPQAANIERGRKEAILNGKAAGLVPANGGADGKTLDAAIAEFSEDCRNGRAHKTWLQYRVSLNRFTECCKKRMLSEITRSDLLKFAAFLREKKELEPRTVHNQFMCVVSFLKAKGVAGLLVKGDRPQFTEDEPEIYEPVELEKFFAACDPTERLWFTFFLQTGMREKEVTHCEWDDVNLPHCEVRVRYKPQFGFNPKKYRAREIPIPDTLAASLKEWKGEKERGCGLLFPTKGCRPKLDFLDVCKDIARRAGLDPATFWLHKFRSTYCTTMLRKGVDLRTVQAWMGHSDLKSTMRYLKPNRGAAVRSAVNAAWD